MSLKILLYSKENENEVVAFNRRLKDGNASFSFPEIYKSNRWPRIDDGRKIYEDYYLVIENDVTVRGGYILKSQEFILNDNEVTIGNIQLPLSEGAVNKAFNIIGIKIVKDALEKQPLLYALGMGGSDKQFPRLLQSLGWSLDEIPFYFKIIHPKIFFRNIKIIRKTTIRKILFDIIAYSGLGWIGFKCFDIFKKRGKIYGKNTFYEEVHSFGEWADELWQKVKDNFIFCSVRDKQTLNILYPNDNSKFIRLRVTIENKIEGWLLLLVTSMSNHQYFGDMRVGSIIDCLATVGKATEIMAAAEKYLRQKNVDLIISNQAYFAYEAAFIKNGYLRGPSNFIFATSRKLTESLNLIESPLNKMHINRGDGDGPMHL